jgi:hypothetical protein
MQILIGIEPEYVLLVNNQIVEHVLFSSTTNIFQWIWEYKHRNTQRSNRIVVIFAINKPLDPFFR